MQFDEARGSIAAITGDDDTFTATCHGCQGIVTCYRGLDDEAVWDCAGGCKEEEILNDGPESEPDTGNERVETRKPGDEPRGDIPNHIKPNLESVRPAGNPTNGHANGLIKPDVYGWKAILYEYSKQAVERAIKADAGAREIIAAMPLESFVAMVEKVRNVPDTMLTHDPDLSATEIEEEVYAIGTALQKLYAPEVARTNGENAKIERALAVVIENAEQAIISNAEYLSRPAVIDRLYYTHHISLGVGGKHEGKTTAVRTEALAIALGQDMYGRPVMQTPVIYAASDDEYPSSRMELLRMGWNPAVPLWLMRIAEGASPDFVLEDIAKTAREHDARFVVLDMLFDFAQIQDELKYAHTREKTGEIQQLADAIDGHVRSTHHSPKWMPDASTAAKAALGSQGIAARFSPILLSKQWAPDLYTVESTSTRDPRGLALPVLCVEKNEMGWLVEKGEMKSWMKWKIYAKRIMDYFEMGEPGKRYSVFQIAQDLTIPKPEVQNALLRMTNGPDRVLERMKLRGNAFTYALINHPNEPPEGGATEMQQSIDGINTSIDRVRNDTAEKVHQRRLKAMEEAKKKQNDEELDEYGIPKGF